MSHVSHMSRFLLLNEAVEYKISKVCKEMVKRQVEKIDTDAVPDSVTAFMQWFWLVSFARALDKKPQKKMGYMKCREFNGLPHKFSL